MPICVPLPSTAKNAFLAVYQQLAIAPEVVSRNHKTRELLNVSFTLKPYERFTSFAARKMSFKYLKAELLWYLKANPYDTMIEDHAQIWKDIRQPSGKFFSNYGQYIFGEQDGLRFVIEELMRDKYSRRAVIPFLNKDHLFENNKDVVCTYGMNFYIRNDELHLSVNMRSNDAIWGMTNDVAIFSIIHEIALKYYQYFDSSSNIKLGNYTHKVDSLHVYERHYGMLDKLVSEGSDGYIPVACPKIGGYKEIDVLINALRNGEEKDLYNSTTSAFTYWVLSDEVTSQV